MLAGAGQQPAVRHQGFPYDPPERLFRGGAEFFSVVALTCRVEELNAAICARRWGGKLGAPD